MFLIRILPGSETCGGLDDFSIPCSILQQRFQKMFIVRAIDDKQFTSGDLCHIGGCGLIGVRVSAHR